MPKKSFKVAVCIALIAAIGGGGYYGYQRYFKKVEEPPVREGMNMANFFAQAEVSDVKEIVTATGVVKLEDEQAVYASSKSRVKEVHVEVGDVVNEGQVLVTYDVDETRKELQKQIKQAEVTLSNNQLTLTSLTLPKSQSDINQLQSNIDTAKRSVEDALATLEGTEAKIIQQENEITLAEKNVENAGKDIERAEKDIEKAEKDIEKAEKDIEKAEKDIEKAEQDIVTSQLLLDAGAITQDEHNKTIDAKDNAIDARDKAIDARDKAIDARDNTIDARDKTIDARDNTIEAKNKTVTALEDLIRQKENNERSIEAARKNVELAETKLLDAQKDDKTSAASDEINLQKQQNSVVSSQLSLQDLKDQLADIVDVTTSPLSGTVTEVAVDKGSTVDVDTALIKVADLNRLLVSANISEYDAPNIAVGQEVIMTSDGIAGVTYYGKIVTISNEAMTQSAVSGTETVVPIEVSVENPDDNIKVGFNLDLEITAVDKASVLNVATTSVLNDYRENKKYVYIVDEDRNLKKVEVETGIVSGSKTEIISGLTEGDSVITSPTDDMEDGMSLMALMQSSGMGSNMGGGNRGQGNTMMFGGPGGGGGGPAVRIAP